MNDSNHFQLDTTDTRNASRISQESDNNNNDGGDRPNSSFKKHPWLNEYIGYRGKQPYCKTCAKTFRSRCPTRLGQHVEKCSNAQVPINTSHKEKVEKKVKLSSDVNEKNLHWTNVIIRNNIPLKTIDSIEFKNFVEKYIPDWKLPKQNELLAAYVPAASRKLTKAFQKQIQNICKPSLSIEFDFWQDIDCRPLLGVVASDLQGYKYLLDIKDASNASHSEVLVSELVDILAEIPSLSINCLVSNNTTVCRKARNELSRLKGYEHLIHYRCLTQFLNDVYYKITNDENVARTIVLASRLTGFISSNPIWLSRLRCLEKNSTKPERHTRLYSTVVMFERLMHLQTVIMQDIFPCIEQELKASNKPGPMIILDWVHLGEVYKELKSLYQCISLIESKNASVGSSFKAILDYSKGLLEDETNVSQTRTVAKAVFLSQFDPSRIDQEEFGLLISSYALDRRNNMRYLTDAAIDLSLETIVRIANRTGSSLSRIQSSIIDEFNLYRDFQYDYGTLDLANDPAKWWNERQASDLARIAARIAHLKASSSNIRKTYVTSKFIHSENKLNPSVSSLVHLARIKISDGLIFDDEELHTLDYNIEESLDCTYIDQNLTSATTSNNSDFTEIPSWIYGQDESTILGYQNFFKYFKFSITRDVKRLDSHPVEKKVQVSEDEIQRLLQAAKASRNT